MPPDLWPLYHLMHHSCCFEQAVTRLWTAGLISGKMHLGTGEEAIAAGVVSQLRPDDALALNHRGTPPLLMCGVDPRLILAELLGRPARLAALEKAVEDEIETLVADLMRPEAAL